jgi:hypothetical protein
MNIASGHHQWLHLNFPVPVVRSTRSQTEAIPQMFSHNLRGRRVWTKHPIIDWSRGQVVSAPDCGGTVAFHDADDDITVIWDGGQVTIHRKNELLRLVFLIGAHRTMQDHINCLANRCQCKASPSLEPMAKS